MSRGWRTFWAILTVLVLLASASLILVHERPLWLALQRVRYHLWRSGVHSHYVMVDGHRIHYFEAAPPNGAPGVPLLLIHGLGARSEDWSPMIPSLAASGFHVYAPDLLGYGRSDRPADANFGISLEEQTVADFMGTLGLSHADVVGWSMGGWITMKLALDHPSLLDRVVLYDSAGVYFQAGYDFSVFTPVDPGGVQRLLALLMPNPPAMPSFIMRDAVRTLRQNAWVVHRSVASMTSGSELLDFHLYALKQPMLIVWGEQDRLIPPSAGETIHRLVPRSVLALEPGCAISLPPSAHSRFLMRQSPSSVPTHPYSVVGSPLPRPTKRSLRRLGQAATRMPLAVAGRCAPEPAGRTAAPSPSCSAGGCRASGSPERW